MYDYVVEVTMKQALLSTAMRYSEPARAWWRLPTPMMIYMNPRTIVVTEVENSG